MEPFEKTKKEQEFMKAYENLAEPIFRHCFFRVSDREKAKDLAQDTFVKTWEYMVSGKEILNLKTFLYKVASNLIIDHYRKHKNVSLDALAEDGFDKASGEEGADIFADAEYSQVMRVLKDLDERHQEIIIWRYVDGLVPSEIADLLGVTENLASVRLNRAIKKLKEKLKI